MFADFALPTLAVSALALLAAAGVDHASHPRRLRGVLDRHALLPAPARTAVGSLLGPIELALAAAGASVLAAAAPGPTAIGTLVAALGGLFLAYLGTLLRTRPGLPCGCSGPDDGQAGPFDLGRPALVLAGGLALATSAHERLASLGVAQRATTVLAGVALAMAVDLVARANRPVARPVTVLGREP
jgi:hypothetical protein